MWNFADIYVEANEYPVGKFAIVYKAEKGIKAAIENSKVFREWYESQLTLDRIGEGYVVAPVDANYGIFKVAFTTNFPIVTERPDAIGL